MTGKNCRISFKKAINGADIIKKMKSWSKPEGEEKLIGHKKVDWSIFKYGTQIPIVFHEEFEKANQGARIEKGENEDVQLMLDKGEFSAKIVNINNNQKRDILQLRYDSNKELINLLKDKFSFSYNYLKDKYENNEQGGYHKTPDEKAEYIEFYETDQPFNYRVKLIATKETQKQNIWWVNQGYLFYFTPEGFEIIQGKSPETNWPDFIKTKKIRKLIPSARRCWIEPIP